MYNEGTRLAVAAAVVDLVLALIAALKPVYYDPGKESYDYARYAALLGEAQYFGIVKLEDWILEQRYLNAVKMRYSIDHVGERKYREAELG